MTLQEVVQDLDRLDQEGVIFAVRHAGEFSPSSQACVLSLTDEELTWPTSDVANKYCPTMDYVLEVFLAKEVVETSLRTQRSRPPSPDDGVRAVIHYAEFDA